MIKKSLVLNGIILIILAVMSTSVFSQRNPLQKFKDLNYKTLPPAERVRLLKEERRIRKQLEAQDDRHDQFKETIIQGNQIRVLVTNQGSISTPTADNPNADLVWPAGPSGLGYAYEFGPLVGAEVVDKNGDTIQVISDGFISSSDGDTDPETGESWGWEPRLGFSDLNSNEVATFSDLDRNLDGKPDSWPQSWYNDVLGRYVWPAFLGDDATSPDEEVYYVMDDFDNAEFEYYPSPSDSSIRGLGLELQVRIFQFNNALAEDLIFLVYTITNVSEKRLDKVYLGMFGDPHVGGPRDWLDDEADFISPFNEDFPECRNFLYAWDADDSGDLGKDPGYFGYLFLESPGLEDDMFNNDNDLFTDESQFNDAGTFGFDPITNTFHWSGDEDGDWDEEFDDVGVDGIANTFDYGEGDGKPTQRFYLDVNQNSVFDPGEPFAESRLDGYRFDGGEPNFGFLDIAESDQLGLTSFNALLFGGSNRPKNDPLMWDLISTSNQRPDDPPPVIPPSSDNVFIYGSGPFTLEPGESHRFSIGLLMGLDFDDLVSNCVIAQQVFANDYRFARPPRKPTLKAVPGEGKVTLYWDDVAESSFDPFIARANPTDPQKGFDFEGYRVYRSRDWSFNDTQTITDSKGIPFLSEPLKLVNGAPAQWDLDNEHEGLSIEYAGRGVRYDLGKNTGLVHSFVDSNNVLDGVTYFYAVTSYDHGDEVANIPPSESQRTVQRDAVTRLFTLDINTAMVTPGRPASGYVEAGLIDDAEGLATRESGDATGKVQVEVLDPLLVQDNKKYDLFFEDIGDDSIQTTIGYTILDDEVKTGAFTSRDTFFVQFGACCAVQEGSVNVTTLSGGTIDPSIYTIDYETGRIRGTTSGDFPVGESYEITYKIKPVFESTLLKNEDGNRSFDGLRVIVENDSAMLTPLITEGGKSGFKVIETGTNFSNELTIIDKAEVGRPNPYPADFEIHFFNYDTTAAGEFSNPANTDTAVALDVVAPFKIFEVGTGQEIDFFIDENIPKYQNKRWDWVETINLLQPNHTQVIQTTYSVLFSPPVDTFQVMDSTGVIDSLDVHDPIYPGEGDIFLFFSNKGFDPGDKYSFTTRAVKFENEQNDAVLEDVIVVPNPYIAFSSSEIAGVRTGDRDDRQIQFRNLPPKCTIRIYTIVGELVATIEKDDPGNMVPWNLLSFESQAIAYGVYIYHVEAPGIGNKIGRFAIIK